MTHRAWPRPTTARPFQLVHGAAVSRLVLTCEHASARLPRGLAARGAAAAVLRQHWGHDIGAWDVARIVARRLRASLVGGSVSRLYVDLNRWPGDPTLVVPVAGGVALPWNQRLSADDVERRIGAYHVPYHVEVDRLVIRRLTRGVRPLLLAVHSFTGELDGRRRSYDMGVLFAEHEREARILGRALRAGGLRIRYNQPYSGLEGLMYSIQRHGAHHGLPCLELEMSQDLLASRAPGHVAATVARAVGSVLEAAAR